MFIPVLSPYLRFFAFCFLLMFGGKASCQSESDTMGMDVLIISTSTQEQQKHWETQLNELRGKLIKQDAYLIVIHEQWPGGAGNGFGTLYAYQEAIKKAKELYQLDLLDFQKQGHSVAIYHTSGQGKRMSPLTASEKNNKSAVKLPTGLPFYPENTISILEAVIWQSAALAPHRKGRLSVFWGDQIFLSNEPLEEETTFEIDIYAKGRPMPNQAQWEADGLEKYGFFAFSPQGNSCYLEKTSYATIQQLIEGKKIAKDRKVAISLGSFSLSANMVAALLEEFSSELEQKNEMMNVEHSLWMPLTLDLDLYVKAMTSMGWPKERALSQHERLSTFKEHFQQAYPQSKLLGVSDIGQDGYWWDYGTIDNYFDALHKLIKEGPEANAMRKFYQIPINRSSNCGNVVQIDATSVVLGSSIASGSIKNSIVIGVHAKSVNFDQSVALMSNFGDIHATNSLFYNVTEEEELISAPKSVRADLKIKKLDETIKISTRLGRDGKADWETRLEGNPYSYAELEKLNLEPTWAKE